MASATSVAVAQERHEQRQQGEQPKPDEHPPGEPAVRQGVGSDALRGGLHAGEPPRPSPARRCAEGASSSALRMGVGYFPVKQAMQNVFESGSPTAAPEALHLR